MSFSSGYLSQHERDRIEDESGREGLEVWEREVAEQMADRKRGPYAPATDGPIEVWNYEAEEMEQW